jgi:hypothetical protein
MSRHSCCATDNMSETPSNRRLVFVKAEDLDVWRCRPLGTVDVLDLKDRRVGRFDGLILDAQADRPLFLVIRRTEGKGSPWFLAPVGDAWFDQTARAIRVDANPRGGEAPAFDPDAFEKMSTEEAEEFERRVLGACCPEVGVHRDGTPDYARHSSFQCPAWLRPMAVLQNSTAGPSSP